METIKRMRKLILSLLLTILFGAVQAQIFNPVKWQFSTKHIKDNQYYIVFNSTIDEGWAVYSQYLESDDGPIATSITFEPGDHFELIGKAEEDPKTRKEGFDQLFDMNLIKYYKTMKIKQQVVVNDFDQPVSGYLTFMTCDDTRCLPPEEIDFSLKVSLYATKIGEAAVIKKETKKETAEVERSAKETSAIVDAEVIEEAKVTPMIALTPAISAESQLYGLSPVSTNNAADCDNESQGSEQEGKTLTGIFILGMLGGFLALLTPCVFPLIPLTVSFFTKGSEGKKKGSKNAILYGVFIFAVYALLSAPFHLLDSINPDILNEISTNVWLNIAFFVIFLFFAFSFFGYYEITMPGRLTNKVSAAEGAGGIIGIFFMALTLSLVSFSCTGPILGSLLAGALSSDGGAWQLSAGMSGFGLALALPFALFAMFPDWMSKLPKSGGWLNSVKVVLGFIELALALKFLSNADLVMHWGILKYELFMALWIVIGLGLGLYVFGIIRFPHDPKPGKLSISRIGLGIAATVFAVYLAFGLTYNQDVKAFNSLKLLSGLAPPAGYSWIYPNDCPNDINCFKDLESGLAYARKQNKPVLLDFTGYACVNCRKMEEHVWSNSRIFDYINDDYVLISLYVDDKSELPEEEKIEVERVQGGKRKLRNYGHKWAHFQTKYFYTNSQPYYVLLSPDGRQMLNQPVGYTPDIDEYEDFLKCGLSSFESL